MGTAGTGIIERSTSQALRWWPVAVGVRLVVASVLVFGPATDEPAELDGWDAERFQEIADRDLPAWSGQPIEYPPGSVVVIDRLAGDDVVETHRRLVALSLVLDLGLALAIRRRHGTVPSVAYLFLGLPLVPFGYQRLDTLVTTVAAVGAMALLSNASRADGSSDRGRRRLADAVAATAIAVGALIKVWPLLLVVGAVAVGRWRAAVGAIALTGIAGAAWLVSTGDGLAPIDQVLSLRGATGWHVESLPGSLTALVGSEPAALELNAYRIGTLRPGLVTIGRSLAVATMALLALAGRRRLARSPNDHAGQADPAVFCLAVLGSVAALLATAPLLSPQFLVWTTPLAALALARPRGSDGPGTTGPVALAGLAALLTGLALHVFGPAGLAETLPAALLTTRNIVLVTLPLVCLAALGPIRPSGTTTGRLVGERERQPTGGSSESADR